MAVRLRQYGSGCNRCGRTERSLGSARLAALEAVGHKMGLCQGLGLVAPSRLGCRRQTQWYFPKTRDISHGSV